jgi:hypothetical protein
VELFPLTLKQANQLIEKLHRHHKPVTGHRFSIGLKNKEGKIIGACVVGRPVARGCDAYNTAEVTRLVTDQTPNGCSLLYAAAARAAKAMGFNKIQTYILEEEPGTSLKAAGWVFEGVTKGGYWNHSKGNPRRKDQPMCPKQRWSKQLNKEKVFI